MDDILRFAFKTLTQLRVLGRNPHGAGIQVAHAHHHAAHGHKGSRGKTELLRAQHTGNGNVPACHQLTVRLKDYLIAQAVHDQGLVCFRHAQFPWKTCIIDGIPGGRPGPSVIRGNQDDLGPCLGHACGHCPNPCLRHQLDGYPGPGIGIL